ncbi:MAG TPA: inositol monophosphatase [Dehalococcoidia bacterium]|nr:inositol monophosphatase [Chloroflexota bacterium]MQF94432.1 inositol monophosphatase [SAR202 cluster bacterium]HAA95916.1 inositol monophosphatase [Dehalococcoidia bacterium]HCL26577.1 inositol monophosphatase [Dehalococcoidia bacterium]|tara:strand:- start:4 stop:825 length:822 start_codon:yes stop_codon:yes gene_type:complete
MPDEFLPVSKNGRPAMDLILEAARAAGAIIRDRFNSEKEVSFKGRKDIVTDVDLAAEKTILDLLTGEFPEFSILAEESKPVDGDSPYKWVVDPLDGTRNYAHGIPHFCTIIALAKNDHVIASATYDPVREEMFTAEEGKGAFMNGIKVEASDTTEVSSALLCCDLGYVDEKAALAIDMIRALWPDLTSTRLLGSAGLGVAYAASGRVDLFFHHSLAPWDIAGGLILAQEAGARVVNRQGNDANLYTPGVIISNPTLVADFLKRTDGMPWRTAA